MSSRSNNPQHSSRHDNQSVSSASSTSRNERTRRATQPAVESAVTRLLVSIKELLESLTQWSKLQKNEQYVSDVYVRLGNDFNAAVAAFAPFNIDMSELMSVPDDLRDVLEQCLAEEATPQNLEIYLPTVRQIITNLLTGLRGKQSVYRRIVNDHRRSEQSAGGHERNDSRSSRGSRSSKSKDYTHRVSKSRGQVEGEPPEREQVSRKSGPSSGKRQDLTQAHSLNNGDQFIGGFSPGVLQTPQSITQPIEEETNFPLSESQTDQFFSKRVPEPTSPHSSQPSASVRGAYSVDPQSYSQPDDTLRPPPTAPVPASVKRYSLVDKPVAPPPVVVEPPSSGPDNGSASPPPDTPPIESAPIMAPAVANSLAALKKNDVLERRASKRFSTFNITKMTGGSAARERSLRGGHPNRRSLAVSSALTPGELDVLTEVDDEELQRYEPVTLGREGSGRSRSKPRTLTAESRQATPPVPKYAMPPELLSVTEEEKKDALGDKIADIPADPSKITVFLQVGREVKKVVIEPGISFASLRVLFVDKFSYSPGQDNFPAIYIRDPSSGVQYELEDTDEVKEKCLLSLNIEPLDQIKQHIDSQISSLSSGIMELKAAVVANHRPSMFIPSIDIESLAESTPGPNRPTDRQLQHVARRLSRIAGDPPVSPVASYQPISAQSFSFIQPQMTGQTLQSQMTGVSVLSDYTTRVVSDLKTQFDEVQNLRRDLAIMRQLYTEFMKQTKDSLGTLRTQTQSVKQLANAGVGGARGYIDSGKKKLDSRSQSVLTEVERLLDTVESMRDDVTKRQITPKDQYIKNIKKDLGSVSKELESLTEHIKTIKPMWKKTWEEELQNIVEEQQFLTHQEEFLNDLLEDYKAAAEVYGHIEKVISLRGPGANGAMKARNGLRGRSFNPPPAEEGDGLSNVMLEIRTAAVDPEKRMKAIEASQKNRQKELAGRSDELHSELSEFVGSKRLKMTGGAEEAERVRQKRSEMTLKAMFNANAPSPPLNGSELPPLPPNGS